MNLNIPDLNHSFSLITVRGITRTYRSKQVQNLLDELSKFCKELALNKPVGFTTEIDTQPCRVAFKVKTSGVDITFTGDADRAAPINLTVDGLVLNLNGFPVNNSTIITLVSSLLLKNTLE